MHQTGFLYSFIRSRSVALSAVVAAGACVLLPLPVRAAEDDDVADDAQVAVEAPLYEREPFDRLTLDASNGGAVVDVYPLTLPDRMAPLGRLAGQTFRIRRLQDPPDRQYDVAGANVEKIARFHELLMAAATELIDAEQLDKAFAILDRLVDDYRQAPGLDALLEKFHLADAAQLFRRRRFDEALLALDEVFQLDPQRVGLDKLLERVVTEVLRQDLGREDYAALRRRLEYVRQRYGSAMATVGDGWEKKLADEASQQVTLARRLFAEGDATEALTASRRARRIWPSIAGVDELNREILAQYPRVTVGVVQPYLERGDDAQKNVALMNWAWRRSHGLLRRSLVDFAGFTAEGGNYRCQVGTIDVSADRGRLLLRLQGAGDLGAVGYELARALLRLADDREVGFDRRWAEYLASVFVPAPGVLEFDLTRPNLRPLALLPTPNFAAEPALSAMLESAYERATDRDSRTSVFQLRSAQTADGGPPREIVERSFSIPEEAADALIRGEVDVIDRVYPTDLARLTAAPNIRVVSYRLPTVHFLTFSGRQSLLRRPAFRRGLLYSINRDGFVDDELLAGDVGRGSQVISAPLPIGLNADDPLGYAYDRSLEPREYNPALGLVLMRLAQTQYLQQQSELAATTQDATIDASPPDDASSTAASAATEAAVDEVLPSLPSLILAHPNGALVMAACSAIASDLRRVGFDVSLRPLDDGAVLPSDGEWDLLYVEATFQEPLVDLPELIIGHDLLGDQGGLLWQAVQGLQDADSWNAAREQFATIHKLAYDHTPLLPLWQVVEHLAYRDYLDGLGVQPVSLYQHIADWRLTP